MAKVLYLKNDFGVYSQFDGRPEHFAEWKLRIRTILLANKLMDVVLNGPTESSGSAKREKREETDAKEKESKAHALLVSSLGSEPLQLVLHIDPEESGSAAQVWKIICARYETATATGKAHIRRLFLSEKMKKGEKFDVFEARVKQHAARLKNLKDEVREEDMIDAILNGLPKEWMSVTSALRVQKELKYADMVREIKNHEERKEIIDLTESENEENNYREKGLIARTNIVCGHCGKKGHEEKRCWSTKECNQCHKKGHIARYCTEMTKKEESAKSAVTHEYARTVYVDEDEDGGFTFREGS